MRLDDPAVVRDEYASEAGLAGRKAAYRFADGPDPREIAFSAVAEARPRRILEVGCGEGELAERMQRELGAEIVALDQSERMVELTRARGVDARLGDVQELPFEDDEFDAAVAAWMLFHVRDIDGALAELARVVGPGGRLVAVTNGEEHLRELRELLGTGVSRYSFSGENGSELLERHFARVERRDATGWIAFPGRAAAQAYVDASKWGQLPEFEGPLRVRRAPYVFVADK
ncbi:MAG: methyltransferase domain-containing protein [Gaiellaceae bacterium]